MKYEQRINKESQEDQKVQFVVSHSKLQAQADLLAVQQQISSLESNLAAALSATTGFSLTKAAELQYELDRLNEIVKIMEKLNKELF